MRHTLVAWVILLGLICFTSCVPQKKLILLQENPEVKNQGNADELLKTFQLQKPIYRLEAGDVLSLKVQSTTPDEYNFLNTPTVVSGNDDPVLSGYTIDAAGDILLPVVGRIQIAGLTMPEARIKVTEALMPYLADPTVNLRLLTFTYTIIGEVTGQGQFTTYQDDINVLEAIASAGGFTNYSNRSQIKLIRYEEGKAKLYNFSLLDDNTISMSNFYLRPDDTIVIDPLPAKNIRENYVANLALGLSVLTTISLLITRLL